MAQFFVCVFSITPASFRCAHLSDHFLTRPLQPRHNLHPHRRKAAAGRKNAGAAAAAARGGARGGGKKGKAAAADEEDEGDRVAVDENLDAESKASLRYYNTLVRALRDAKKEASKKLSDKGVEDIQVERGVAAAVSPDRSLPD